MKPVSLPYLHTIPDAASRMSTKVSAVRWLIHEGRLKFIRVGNAHLISPEAISEFIRKNEKTYSEHQNSEL
jgi:excisionase family DNA binding protein